MRDPLLTTHNSTVFQLCFDYEVSDTNIVARMNEMVIAQARENSLGKIYRPSLWQFDCTSLIRSESKVDMNKIKQTEQRFFISFSVIRSFGNKSRVEVHLTKYVANFSKVIEWDESRENPRHFNSNLGNHQLSAP